VIAAVKAAMVQTEEDELEVSITEREVIEPRRVKCRSATD
jgi:hypothetical protein